MERYYVYILRSKKDNNLYIGYTDNLKRRLTEHAHGQVIATKNRLPLTLIRYEYFINRKDAKAREKYLKSGGGHQQLEIILKETLSNS